MKLFNRSFKVKFVVMAVVAVMLLAGCQTPMSMPTSAPDAMITPVVEMAEMVPPQAESMSTPMQESMSATMPMTETVDTAPMPGPTSEPAPEPTMMPTQEGKTVDVALDLFLFKPDRIEINVGDTVVWTNKDDIQHTVTFGTPEQPGALFDSGFFTLGQTFSYTFAEPGEYAYFCQRHPHMQGVIVVK